MKGSTYVPLVRSFCKEFSFLLNRESRGYSKGLQKTVIRPLPLRSHPQNVTGNLSSDAVSVKSNSLISPELSGLVLFLSSPRVSWAFSLVDFVLVQLPDKWCRKAPELQLLG